MAPEVLVALAVVAVLAFVAGWLARGRADANAGGQSPHNPAHVKGLSPHNSANVKGLSPEETPAPAASTANVKGLSPHNPAGVKGLSPHNPADVKGLSPQEPVAAPDAAAATGRLLDRAIQAMENAVDRWLDEGDAITPAGKAAVGELDRAIQRADVAAARIEENSEARFAALDALDGLREVAQLLQAYREGRAIDAQASRELDRLEDEIGRARADVSP